MIVTRFSMGGSKTELMSQTFTGHPCWVKVQVSNGQLWLPGGRIPVNYHGMSFARQGGQMLQDLIELHEQHPLPEGLEMFVTSHELAQVASRNKLGHLAPVFKTAGSKYSFDLVLPDPGWVEGGYR